MTKIIQAQTTKWIFCFLFLSLTGCATLSPSHPVSKSKKETKKKEMEAATFFKVIDRKIKQAAVRDVSNIRIKGYPYLRADRFIISRKGSLPQEAQQERWVQWMRELDQKARAKEIMNLPQIEFIKLARELDLPARQEFVIQVINQKAEALLAQHKQQPDFFDRLQRAVRDPGEYSTLMRIFGVYPVFAIPTIYQTKKIYHEFYTWHKTALKDLPVRGEIKSYGWGQPSSDPAGIARKILSRAAKDAFGLPLLDKESLTKLFELYAPVYNQDTLDENDYFGEIIWDMERVSINTQKPTVYYYASFNYVNQKPVLQLNYASWYLGRYGPYAPRLEHGPLDGLTLRISIDLKSGEPVMMDVMNSCGCYYFYVPPKQAIDKIVDFTIEPDPLVPTWLPAEFPEKPIQVFINTGWHQVQKVYAQELPQKLTTYDLIPYDQLESLSKKYGQHESVFDELGLMKDSYRIEKYLLFSSGIHSIGYMRQRGHHAVKIIGRMHFTDPDVYDKHFIYK